MISLNPQATNSERPQGRGKLVAWLLAAFAAFAVYYALTVAAALFPFNAGTWLVGEGISRVGWRGYLISAVVHLAAATALWRQWHGARWFAMFLLAAGVLAAVPEISSAVVDLRMAGIALWGSLIMLRTTALYALLSAE